MRNAKGENKKLPACATVPEDIMNRLLKIDASKDTLQTVIHAMMLQEMMIDKARSDLSHEMNAVLKLDESKKYSVVNYNDIVEIPADLIKEIDGMIENDGKHDDVESDVRTGTKNGKGT